MNDSVNSAIIEHRETGSRAICIGSDPAAAMGLRPTLVLADEPSSWNGGGDAMLSSLRTGLGKVPNSRLVALGTRPSDEAHWFSAMLDGGDGGGRYVQSHQASADDPPFRVKTWHRACEQGS